MPNNKRKLFCDINPTCYKISIKKENLKRDIKDFFSHEVISKNRTKEKLKNQVFSHSSDMIKRGEGIDPVLQENKAINIKLACRKINGIIICPGESFSFWRTVGKLTAKKGFKDGRILKYNKLIAGIGGGLCNLANTVHILILHSPLEVTEFHSHSDALAPDEGKRVPFSAGTSVSYNHVDYRFKNNTNQKIQLLTWCEGDILHAELRSEKEFPWTYRLIEENHHFSKEGEKYYRISKIYKEIIDRKTSEVIRRELVLDNHSEVMFDNKLIPADQIR